MSIILLNDCRPCALPLEEISKRLDANHWASMSTQTYRTPEYVIDYPLRGIVLTTRPDVAGLVAALVLDIDAEQAADIHQRHDIHSTQQPCLTIFWSEAAQGYAILPVVRTHVNIGYYTSSQDMQHQNRSVMRAVAAFDQYGDRREHYYGPQVFFHEGTDKLHLFREFPFLDDNPHTKGQINSALSRDFTRIHAHIAGWASSIDLPWQLLTHFVMHHPGEDAFNLLRASDLTSPDTLSSYGCDPFRGYLARQSGTPLRQGFAGPKPKQGAGKRRVIFNEDAFAVAPEATTQISLRPNRTAPEVMLLGVTDAFTPTRFVTRRLDGLEAQNRLLWHSSGYSYPTLREVMVKSPWNDPCSRVLIQRTETGFHFLFGFETWDVTCFSLIDTGKYAIKKPFLYSFSYFVPLALTRSDKKLVFRGTPRDISAAINAVPGLSMALGNALNEARLQISKCPFATQMKMARWMAERPPLPKGHMLLSMGYGGATMTAERIRKLEARDMDRPPYPSLDDDAYWEVGGSLTHGVVDGAWSVFATRRNGRHAVPTPRFFDLAKELFAPLKGQITRTEEICNPLQQRQARVVVLDDEEEDFVPVQATQKVRRIDLAH